MRSNSGDRVGLADAGGDVMDEQPTIWLRTPVEAQPFAINRLVGAIVADDLIADDGTNLRGRYLCDHHELSMTDSGTEYVGFMTFWPEDGVRVLLDVTDGLLGAQAVQVYQRRDFRPILDPIRVVAGAM